MENLELKFMQEALKEARKALKEGEVPVGCVIVQNNVIVARAHNKCEKLGDPTAHAELLAIKKLCKSPLFLKNEHTKMYVTLEPCMMCVGAILHANINEVIFAVENSQNGYLYTHSSDMLINGSNKERNFISRTGYLKNECKELLDSFFINIRKE